MEKKLIYVLNEYSKNSVQHFYHIENLLKKMADNGVKIALVIEKTDCIVNIHHPNIRVYCQKQRGKLRRCIELSRVLKKMINNGYKKIFIRISINSAIISILTGALFGGKVYYWQSGTTLEVDAGKRGIQKIKWLVKDYLRLWFVKTFTYRFVTGPEYMVDYYASALHMKKSKILMLYNDIDINRFRPSDEERKRNCRRKLGIDESQYVVLMVHRLSPVRKTALYIPAIMEDPYFHKSNVHLFIIGDGPERKLLDEKMKKSSSQALITFLGSKPNKEIQDYYAAADLFVNPSYTEGFPRVIIEAMAAGLPIVATNAGGTVALLGEKQKEFVVDRTDIKGFSKKLIETHKNSELRAQLIAENIITCKKFSTEIVAQQYEQKIFE